MLEIGILMLAAALLAILVARAVFIRPSPPRWTTWDTPGNLIVCAITALAGFGLASTGVGIARVIDGTVPAWHGLVAFVIVAAVAGGLFALRHFRRPVPGAPA